MTLLCLGAVGSKYFQAKAFVLNDLVPQILLIRDKAQIYTGRLAQ